MSPSATFALDPNTLPTGGAIAGGTATISQAGSRLNIQQQSSRAILNWNTFNIGSQASVNFQQPSASSVVLNRVTGGGGVSEIYGSLTANGQVFLINPSGTLFGNGAQVNVGGLVSSSLDISNADFLNGNYRFVNGGAAGSIVNYGTLTAADGGYIALLAPQVRNEGVIAARLGTVAIGAGNAVTLDLSGTGLLSMRVDQSAVDGLIANNNLVEAGGGTVIMSARAAGELAGGVINNSGEISATRISGQGGVIRLEAGDITNTGTVAADGASGGQVSLTAGDTLITSGSVSARGSSGQGGQIQMLGDKVGLSGAANIDASGDAGGGTVLVGGNFRGTGPQTNASATFVGSGVSITADALTSGNGGYVAVWSTDYTQFYGSISVRGGSQTGNGGYVETSSHNNLSASGIVDAGAPKGSSGAWLLDPFDVSISNNADTNVGGAPNFIATATVANVSANSIQTALNGGTSVTVTTGTNGNGAQTGNITVFGSADSGGAVNISTTPTANVNLTLQAAGSILFDAGASIVASGANGLSITLDARNDGGVATASGAVVLNSATITTNGGSLVIGGGLAPATGNAIGTTTIPAGVALQGTTTINAGVGTFTANGQGSSSAPANNFGFETTASITASGINIAGVGGTGDTNSGISLSDASLIGTGAGGVVLTGTGTGTASTLASGVVISGPATISTSSTGGISITGTGGPGVGGNGADYGVFVSGTAAQPVSIQSTGGGSGGAITINGTGGANGTAAHGVFLNGGTQVSSNSSGAISLIGGATDGTGNGIFISDQGTSADFVSVTSIGSASIVLNGTTTGGQVGLLISGTGSTNHLIGGGTGTGSVALQGSGISVSNGTVDSGSGDILLDGGASPVALSGTLTTTSPSATAVQITNASTLQIGSIIDGNSGTVTLSESSAGSQTPGTQIAGAGLSLVKQGAGTFTLSENDSSYNGGTTISAGTINVTHGNGLGAGGVTIGTGTSLVINNVLIGNVTTLQGTGALLGTGTAELNAGLNNPAITLGGNSTIGNTDSGTLTIRGVISDGTGASFTKTGAGTLLLQSPNTYSGGTTISNGTVAITGATSMGTGAVTLNDSSTGSNNTSLLVAGPNFFGGSPMPNSIVVANQGTGTSTIGTTGNFGTIANFTGPLTLNRATTLVDGSGVGAPGTSFTNNISGNVGALTINGGTVTFSGTNTYTGTTTVASGSLAASGGAAIPSTGAVILSASGTDLTLNSSQTIGSLTGGAGTTVTMGANTLTTGDATTTTFAGAIGGSGGLTKQGSGTFTLTAANGFSGATSVNVGTLEISGAGSIGNSAGVTVGNTGVFQLTSVTNGIPVILNLGGTFRSTGTSLETNGVTLAGNATIDTVSSGDLFTLNGGINGANGLTLNGVTGSTIDLQASMNIGGLSSTATGQNVSLEGGVISIGGSTTFANTGTLEIGNIASNSITFVGGLTATAPSTVTTNASIFATNAPIALGTVSVAGSTSLNGGTGAITTGAVTSAGAGLPIAGSGADTFSSITGIGILDFFLTGGSASVAGNLSVGTISTLANNFNIALLGGNNGVTGTATFNNTGSLTLGASGGTSLFANGLNANSPSSTTINGAINTTNSTLTIGPTTVGSASSVSTGAGSITFNSTLDGGQALSTSNTSTTTFTGAVGGTTPLVNLTTAAGGAVAMNGGSVTTAGAQTYNNPVSLGAATTITGVGNTFASTVNGAQALIVNDSGTTTFGAAVGGTTPLTSLTTNAGGSTVINGGSVTTTGAQNYNDAVVLGTTTIITGAGNAFGSTVNGAQALTVNDSGTTTFGGAVGGVSALGSVTTNFGGTTAINGGGVTTTGAQTYNDPVALGANTTLTGTTPTFALGIAGAGNDLTLAFSGSTTINGAAFAGINNLTSNNGGTTNLIGSVTTNGTQTYTDNVALAGAMVAAAGNNLVIFGGTVDGAQPLVINGAGGASFGGPVGSGIPLASLTVSNSAGLGGDVTTTGNQSYGSATLTASSILSANAGAGTIGIGTLTGGANNLTLTGLATIGTTTGTGALTANQTLATTGDVSVGGVVVAGTSDLGGNVTSAGSQTYTGAVTLAAPVVTLAGSTPAFFGGVVGGGNDLTLAFSGATTINGATFTGIKNLTSNSGGITNLSGAITTSGTQTYSDAVTLIGPTSLGSSGNQAILLIGTVDGAQTLAVNTTGATVFGSAVGGSIPLASLTTNAGGSTNISSVATTGAQTYNDALTTNGAYTTNNSPFTTASTTTLAAATSISTGSGNVMFGGNVDGANSLVVNTTGIAQFNPAVVGGIVPLTGLTVTASTIIVHDVTTNGAQQYNGNAIFGSTEATNGGNFTVTGTTSLGNSTIVNTGAGNATFMGAVDGSISGADGLTVNSSGATTFGNTVGATVPLSFLATDASGTTFVGGNVTAGGAITFSDPTSGAPNISLTSTSGAAISVDNSSAAFPAAVSTSSALNISGPGIGSIAVPTDLLVTPGILTIAGPVGNYVFNSPSIPPSLSFTIGDTVTFNGVTIAKAPTPLQLVAPSLPPADVAAIVGTAAPATAPVLAMEDPSSTGNTLAMMASDSGSIRPTSGSGFSKETIHQIDQQISQARTQLFSPALEQLAKNPAVADVPDCGNGGEGVCVKKGEPRKPVAGYEKEPEITRHLALLIGNDRYLAPIPALETPIHDVEDIARVLKDRLGYETRIVRNATKIDIVNELNRLVTESEVNDSVLIVYAGHGYQTDKGGSGYWIPVDGSNTEASTWLSNGAISKFLANISARQVLLLSDSCYSGTLAQERKVRTTETTVFDRKEILRKRSVMVMSSGGDEPVADGGHDSHSLFAYYLLRTLARVNGKLVGADIHDSVRNAVMKEYPQDPQYGIVVSAGGIESGEYLIEKKP